MLHGRDQFLEAWNRTKGLRDLDIVVLHCSSKVWLTVSHSFGPLSDGELEFTLSSNVPIRIVPVLIRSTQRMDAPSVLAQPSHTAWLSGKKMSRLHSVAESCFAVCTLWAFRRKINHSLSIVKMRLSCFLPMS